jgi:hypothetical protein
VSITADKHQHAAPVGTAGVDADPVGPEVDHLWPRQSRPQKGRYSGCQTDFSRPIVDGDSPRTD